ncbi:hypothetical protein EJB05_24871, partial [Eragrostis curvula]
MASGGRAPAVAVAVRPGGSGSRLAARWVAAAVQCNGRATAVAVVHVIPPLTFVPSPTGEQVPVAQVAREAAEAYARDRRARAEEELLQFRRLLGRANVTVETAVVEGDGVAETLLRYAQESGVRSLVLGSASFRWFRRVLSIPNVPSTILEAMQNSCNVFVVSKRKLIMKLAGYLPSRESSANLRIESINHEAFSQTHMSLLFENFTDEEAYSDSCSQDCSSHSASNTVPSSESCEQVILGYSSSNTTGTEGNKSYDALSSVGEAPYSTSNSSEECQYIDEVDKLRKELRDTLVTYDKACEGLVHAKKRLNFFITFWHIQYLSPIQVLSTECSEEARKVEHALEWEEALKRALAGEKANQLEAVNEVEQARRSFTQEAHSSLDKAKIMDAIMSKSSLCRWYSRREIELATDNFSEARKIGEGGYGNVYRCILDHTEVAVKVIQQDSIDKTDEFLKEIEILSELHHPNLVLLLGFCPEIGCLVYEYLKNGSLEDQLFNNKGQQPLHWFLRFQIIFDNYVGKIGDVGFAKLMYDLAPDWQTEYKDTVVAGTMFYMDPEYQQTGTVRPKSDVFALGVIILQLLTGRRPNGLILSVEKAVRNGRVNDILDNSQADWPVAEAEVFAKLGLRCTALKCRDRPDLESEVLPKLDEILHRITCTLNLGNPKLSVPSHFICPITQELMEDPHVAADGHTYEHYAIKAWLKRHKTSPVTRRKLPNQSIIPNHSLRAAIQQWKSQLSSAQTVA